MRSDIPVLILAAGASSRMGCPKQLLTLGGRTLLDSVIALARGVSCSVWVVTGCRGPLIRYRTQVRPHHWVHNAEWASGMASSLQAGLKALPVKSPGVLVLLVDQPGVAQAHLRDLLAAAERKPDSAIASGLNGRPVVPAYLPSRMWPSIASLRGDVGARALLSKVDPYIIPCPAAGLDLDTPSDWRAIRYSSSQSEIARPDDSLATLDKDSSDKSLKAGHPYRDKGKSGGSECLPCH
ncbi:nucleotidyltransferase family protein [Mangrovitalea sediminis]|uniref:nucleotidyltransferase family protein n=1 Tax=Mangrovitalea sediminis TaxID=1982043 RepID=UPI000BE4EEFE|nr:nucleotidyltransferase family protein [Mangrovitalea sediminis]